MDSGKIKECKHTFNQLYEKGKLPFTIPELCGKDAIETATVELSVSDEAYSSNTIKASELSSMTISISQFWSIRQVEIICSRSPQEYLQESF